LVLTGIAKKSNGNLICERTSKMKLNKILTMCAVAAALCLSADNVLAQGFGGGGFGGGGGGFGGGGRRGGGGNFDPAQLQQRILQNIQTQLNITNDTDWTAIQPLIQKVLDAQQALGTPPSIRLLTSGFGGGGFGRRGGGGFGGFSGQDSVEFQALRNAVDSNAPDAQIKDALDKYEASQKAKQAALTAAEDALRSVLTLRQEAQATLMGLLS
jgi:hypothetical protein